jgi:hypothetical protein
MAKRPRLSFLPVRCNHKLRRDSCFHKVNGYHQRNEDPVFSDKLVHPFFQGQTVFKG